ncbi:M20 metallopeptidase family protein [Streptomyces sp. CMB-StM0423]|uniref:M20 metallopeptidase family protein n=1 Tax=Streptomyces sp. CMB-StM0423 TaxID=2059884 RepID=UPI000C7073F3|nr:amidohydrolase [Streptomyces sp. CMB-StM0423]AUH39540.1 amidohydrolase [Streptomyces sp. CMB-StM0423]
MSSDPIHAEVDRRCAAIEPQVVRWRHHLHRNPELPNREAGTAGLIADHLASLDLDAVRTGVSGHGVVGVLRGGAPGDGRVVALRADIDALPVREESGESFAATVVDEDYPGGPFPVAHACGHDGHTAMLLGAATVLAGLRDRLPGTVLFVFQPAEEGAPAGEKSGAKEMLAQGACDDPVPTMAFGMHLGPLPDKHVGYRVGNQFAASCMVRIVLTGRQVHGSTPWEGVDPVPAAGAVQVGIGQMYRQVSAFDPITVTIGHIEDVGRFNIVPGEITLWGTIRCVAGAGMGDVRRRLTTLAEQTAAAYGCTASVEYLQDVPAVHNRGEWIDAVLPTVARVVGEDAVFETPPTLGYDDVSEFVNRFGGVYLMLGAQDGRLADDGGLEPVPGGRGLVSNHNPRFYVDDDALLSGVRLHCHVAYDHLTGALLPRK